MERSKLEQVFPLEQIGFPQEMILIHVEPEEIEAMVQKLREDHLTIQGVQGPVERGDFVLLAPVDGGEARLVNTARPMGAAALAEACLGRREGENFGEGYRIAGIKRRILPGFDDALVQSAGLPEVRTPEQYRAHCLETLRRRRIKGQTEALAQWMAEEWRSRCRFDLDGEELEAVISELEGAVGSYMEEAEWPRERVLEMFAEMLGFPEGSAPTLEDCGRRLMERVLLGRHCLAKYGVVLGREHYEKALEKMAREQGGQVNERGYPCSLFLHEKARVQLETEVKKFIQKCSPFRCE